MERLFRAAARGYTNLFMHCSLAVLAAALLISSGCGYIGDPQPPLANVPAPVTGLTAIQRGASIIVRFAVPGRTTEDMLMKVPPSIDLRIGVGSDPFNVEAWAAQAKRQLVEKAAAGPARVEIPTAEWTGKEVIVAARVVGANGKESAWSNYAIVNVVPPPEQPKALRATATAQGVRLSWQASEGSYRVFRRAGEETAFAPVAEVQKNEWTDEAADFGKRYVYRTEGVVKLANGKEALSDLSEEAAITPRDVFPPATPAGLGVAAGPESIELTWNANAERFVAGYRIYRSSGGAFEKIGDTGLIPAYSDRKVEHGKTYRYQVSAVGETGYESSPSAPVEATLP
jgi:hypothetical protein